MKDKSIKSRLAKIQGIFSIKSQKVLSPKTLALTVKSEDTSFLTMASIGDIIKFKSHKQVKTKDKSAISAYKAKFILKDIKIKEKKIELELSIHGEDDIRIKILENFAQEVSVCITSKSHTKSKHSKHASLEQRKHYKRSLYGKRKMEFKHGEFDPDFEKHMMKYKHKKKHHLHAGKEELKEVKHKHHHLHHC